MYARLYLDLCRHYGLNLPNYVYSGNRGNAYRIYIIICPVYSNHSRGIMLTQGVVTCSLPVTLSLVMANTFFHLGDFEYSGSRQFV